jgi:hypothetical protein
MFEQCPSSTTVNDYLHNSVTVLASQPPWLFGVTALQSLTLMNAWDVVKMALLLSYFVL